MATDLDNFQTTILANRATDMAEAEAVVDRVREKLYESIADAYRAGVSWQEIASATGLSRPRVYQVLARQGVTTKRSHP